MPPIVICGQLRTGSETVAHPSSLLLTSASGTPPINNANNGEVSSRGSIPNASASFRSVLIRGSSCVVPASSLATVAAPTPDAFASSS